MAPGGDMGILPQAETLMGCTEDLAAITRILREMDVSAGHYNTDGTAFVVISGYATVSADDARILERVTS